MIWLVWRQFRTQAMAVYGLLVVLAAVLVIAGRPLVSRLTPTDGTLYYGGIVVMYLLPALIGLFWGAPLVTRELEAGTHRLVWNQSITRARWLATKLALTSLAAAAAAGVLSLSVTWWASPIDALSRPDTIMGSSDEGAVAARLSPLVFAARGIAPVGYAVFAFVLGVTAGILLRRTVLAMAVFLAVFVAMQIAMPLAVRPFVIPPVQQTTTITPANISQLGIDSSGDIATLSVAAPRGAWLLANETVDATGEVTTPPRWVANCMRPEGPHSQPPVPVVNHDCFAKLADLGYRQHLTFQPASRFWPLQWAETAVYLVLSGLLTWLCFWWTRHRLS